MFESRMQLKSNNIQLDAISKTTTQLADHGFYDLANRLWDNAVSKIQTTKKLDELVGQSIADPDHDHSAEAAEIERHSMKLAYEQAQIFQEMLQKTPDIYMNYHYQELESFKTWVEEIDSLG